MVSSATVMTDPALLERLLRNLLENALRYTLRGGIVIGCRRRGNGWRIDVVDMGIGIALADQKLIFESFYQVDYPGRPSGVGLGLGLSIVRCLAHLLSVRVSVTSTPGHGSRFSVDLPAWQEEISLYSRLEPVVTKTLSGCVLIVEDDALLREAMVLLLSEWGLVVIEAASGGEAQAALARAGRWPDMILADYRLRGENGLDVMARPCDQSRCDSAHVHSDREHRARDHAGHPFRRP